MIVMLRKALWDLRWSILWYSAGGAGYTLLVSLVYPTVRAQSETFSKLVATYPKGLLSALGYTSMTTFSGYLGAQSLNVFWPIIVLVFGTLAGAALVAKEIEDGTSEMWLSVPAPRWKLLLAKMVAVAIGVLVAVAVLEIAIVLAAVMDQATVTGSGMLAMAIVMVAFLISITGYSAALSAWSNSRSKAAGLAFAITLAFYMLWLIGGLSDKLSMLKGLSIFTAYTPQHALETGSLSLPPLAALIGIALLCTGLALFRFQRRDAI